MGDVYEVKPAIRNIDSVVDVPGSKSIANRALMISALSNSPVILQNVNECTDVLAMIGGLRQFGTSIEKLEEKIYKIDPSPLTQPDNPINVGDAGTAMRFLTAFAGLVKGNTELTGTKRMQERPIGDLLEGLQCLGIRAKSYNVHHSQYCPPVYIESGGIEHIWPYCMVGGAQSSQYLSAILMMSPKIGKDVNIEVRGNLVSKPYADITLDMMKDFGVKKVKNKDYKKFKVKGNQSYKRKEPYIIESDASSASYMFAAAAIAGGTIKVNNLSKNSKQLDTYVAKVLGKIGCNVEYGKNYIKVSSNRNLKPFQLNMENMPDTAPTLAIVAAFAEGTTVLTGLSTLNNKECRRIDVLKSELNWMNINSETTDDSITIYGGNPLAANIDSHDDHRIAMSFAVAGLKLPGIKIKNPDCVSKSFPDFYKTLESLVG